MGDQREPDLLWQKQNPNWTDQYNKGNSPRNPSKYESTDYDFSKLVLIKKWPESRSDVYDAYNAKENFGHRMDALKHCVDNKIPFLLWNCQIFDWHCNLVDIDYYIIKK